MLHGLCHAVGRGNIIPGIPLGAAFILGNGLLGRFVMERMIWDIYLRLWGKVSLGTEKMVRYICIYIVNINTGFISLL